MAELCLVRLVTYQDLQMLLSWRNNEKVRRHMFTQHEITLKEHSDWFLKASVDPTCRLLIIEDMLGPFGYVQFNRLGSGNVSDWGFYTNPEAPRGSGQKLGKAALSYAFDELKLHKVCGQVIETNARSIAFHKSLGFSQEGLLRDQQCISGTYYSLICFGLLVHEWPVRLASQEIVSDKD